MIAVSAGAAGSGVESVEISSEQADFRLVKITDGLPNPWSLAFLPGGDALITERAGRLWRLGADNKLTSIAGLPEIRAGGQGGLLDIVLHPDYSRNGWIYMSHVVNIPAGRTTAVSRARLSGDRLTDLQRIFTSNSGGSTSRHFGSRLVFDDKGYLYITLGERGEKDRAQDTSDHAGSTIRLFDDGRVPGDNPFGAIYSYGHRNAQGMAFDESTGILWQHEHGPQGGDEVNIIKKGVNYGWPVITHGIGYDGSKIGTGSSAPGMEQPVIYWDPSIAPSGMAIYSGGRFPEWQGDFFIGALAGAHLRRLEVQGRRVTGQEVMLKDQVGRIRDVRQGPDGNLYLLTDERNGALYRIEPAD